MSIHRDLCSLFVHIDIIKAGTFIKKRDYFEFVFRFRRFSIIILNIRKSF